MEIQDVLQSKLDELLLELKQVRTTLKKAAVERDLWDRVEPDFRKRLDDLEKRLKLSKSEIKQSSQDAWSVMDTYARESASLFQECGNFLAGALIRSSGSDNGLCAVADGLLRELGKKARADWNSFTIVDHAERFVDFSRIIRLRFPVVDI